VSPIPWLHRVALNLCYSRLDRRRLDAQPIGDAQAALIRDGGIEPAERAEQRELRAIVRDGIAALPDKHQSVVVLYYLHRLSLQETADVLGIRLGTVKSRLHYALRTLRTHLEGDRRFGGAYRPTGGDEIEANAS
jgi:RNA polymerase sigma-70 factor (ECF subfamily)